MIEVVETEGGERIGKARKNKEIKGTHHLPGTLSVCKGEKIDISAIEGGENILK